MNDLPVTLNQFFMFPEKGLPEEVNEQFEASETMIEVRKALGQQAKGLSWAFTRSKIIGGLDQLLNISMEDILVGAWKKYQELRKYRDQKRYPPNETYLVHLVEHTIKSEHRPYLAILINGVEMPHKIECALSLVLIVKGAILEIKDGKIKTIVPGSCQGKVTLTCGKVVLLNQETKSIDLLTPINLGEGIPLAA